MDLTKIKCVITDFDKTLYSEADLSRMDDHYMQFLFENNLLNKTEDAAFVLRNKYPGFHLLQCVFKLSRENGISDKVLRDWLNNHVYDIYSENMRIVNAEILNKLCKKLPVYVLSDSVEGHLYHYYNEFGYNKSWFAGNISNEYKTKSMSKTPYMKKIVKKHNLSNDEVLMVGDSLKSDIEAARKAGIQSFHVLSVDDTEKLFKELIALS